MAAMSTRPRTDSWWEPTWQRLAAGTLVLFLVIMAFLVGRVRAGTDPGLARETTGTPAPGQVAPVTPGGGGSQTPGAGSGADPDDPFAPPQTDPGTDPGPNGTTDGFGDAVPDQGLDDQGTDGAQGFDDQGNGGVQGFDPPSTHVS
jgi:hypothetical protein